jgi:hypothetical protein
VLDFVHQGVSPIMEEDSRQEFVDPFITIYKYLNISNIVNNKYKLVYILFKNNGIFRKPITIDNIRRKLYILKT